MIQVYKPTCIATYFCGCSSKFIDIYIIEFELENFPDAVEEVKKSEDDGSPSDDSEESGSKEKEDDEDDVADEGDTLIPMDVPFISAEENESSKHATKHSKPKPLHKSTKTQQKDKKKVTKVKESDKAKQSNKEKKVHHSKLKLKSKRKKKQKHHEHYNHRYKGKSKYIKSHCYSEYEDALTNYASKQRFWPYRLLLFSHAIACCHRTQVLSKLIPFV